MRAARLRSVDRDNDVQQQRNHRCTDWAVTLDNGRRRNTQDDDILHVEEVEEDSRNCGDAT